MGASRTRRALQDRVPGRWRALVEMGATNRPLVQRRCRVARLDAAPQLVDRHVEVVQLHADTEATSLGSHLVTFHPSPEPEVEHDAQPEAEDLSGQEPEARFELLADGPVPRRRAQVPQPLVLREAHSASVLGQPRRECGLARSGQATGEDQSRAGSDRAHGLSAQQSGAGRHVVLPPDTRELDRPAGARWARRLFAAHERRLDDEEDPSPEVEPMAVWIMRAPRTCTSPAHPAGPSARPSVRRGGGGLAMVLGDRGVAPAGDQLRSGEDFRGAHEERAVTTGRRAHRPHHDVRHEEALP